MALVEARTKRFLADDKKRERKPTNITIVLEYTSQHIEQYICRLTSKMSDILRNFRVNVSYRTIKLTKMFSSHAEQKLNQNEMCNLVYKYICPLISFYISQNKILLQIRSNDHQTPSINTYIYQHI